MSTIATSFTRNRPRACAFFAGRAWYAGVPAGDKSGWVLFSQVATHVQRLDKCYQANDPTSEILSDIQDDDGGLIPIPDSGEIVTLKALGSVLLVLATKGVWLIRGGDNGFKATEYSVEKVNAAGCIGSMSVVVVDETLFYWSAQAIYAVKVDQAGLAQVQNISESNIKTLYEGLPLAVKFYAQATYNDSEKTIYWLYADSNENQDVYGKFYKNRLLKFDLALQSWYTESLPDGFPFVVAPITTKESFEEEQEFDVLVGEDDVDSNGSDVVVDLPLINAGIKQVKFLSLVNVGTNTEIKFADYKVNRDNFLDWGTSEMPAYILTGYNMGGVGPARSKVASTITVFAKRTEESIDSNFQPTKTSSIKMQIRWDFTDNSYPGKWSGEYEVYRQLRPYYVDNPGPFDDGYPLIITKNRVRGTGKALQIKWQAGENKDMKLVGWSINFVGNTNV